MFVIHSVLGLPVLTFPSSGPSDIGLWMLLHLTILGNLSLLLELCKAVRLPILGLLHLFSFLSRIFSSSSDMPTFQTTAILSYFWWLLSTFHIRIKVSTTLCFYNSFCFHTYASSSYSFQHRIECTSCNFNSFQDFIIAFSI